MSASKRLTIVICTYNGSRHIEEVINAVLGQDDFQEYVQSVIVVDNNSSDHTKDIVNKMGSVFPVIDYQYEDRQGLSFARQHAVKAKSPWVAFLDDDNIVLPGWLNSVVRTIEQNPQAGIINGAVIPMPNENYTSQQKEMLQVFFRDLACTHLTLEESCNSKFEGHPVGAGMCVATEALKKIDSEGWLHLVGRQGDQLFSGEDGELAYRVRRQGYGFVFNPQIKLYHMIPPQRLTDEYVGRLLSGLVKDSYHYISMKPCYVLQRALRVIKYCFQIIFCEIVLLFTKDRVKRIRCRYLLENCKQFIQITCKDQLFRRDV